MVTAYMLIAALVFMQRESDDRDPWESASKLLDHLSRVERESRSQIRVRYIPVVPEPATRCCGDSQKNRF